MSATFWSFCIIGYLVFIYSIVLVVRKKTDNDAFFLAGRKSKWYIIALGMIGTNMSGLTFISVPGSVGNHSFNYLALVIGGMFGMLIVTFVLIPIYYRYKLVSIYTYIGLRFNPSIQKIAASLFLLSRTIGAGARLYLILNVLYIFVFQNIGIPFAYLAALCMLFIFSYTFRSGMQAIVWIDLGQTMLLVIALVVSLVYLFQVSHWSFEQLSAELLSGEKTQIFLTGNFLYQPQHYLKQFLAGFVLYIATIGLDQDLMQKNLTLNSKQDAQKDLLSFSGILLIMNFLFLVLGFLLYNYQKVLPNSPSYIAQNTDFLYPWIALNYLPLGVGFLFILGLIASTFSTTDAALTSLTTSFCIDILALAKSQWKQPKIIFWRTLVHTMFAIGIFLVCISLYYYNDQALLEVIFKIAAYTYGPLLALFVYALVSKQNLNFGSVLFSVCLGPLVTHIFTLGIKPYYSVGNELIIVNALLTGLTLFFSKKSVR